MARKVIMPLWEVELGCTSYGGGLAIVAAPDKETAESTMMQQLSYCYVEGVKPIEGAFAKRATPEVLSVYTYVE